MPWTIYPRGQPTPITITRTGILLEDGRLAILAEGQPLAGQNLSAMLQRDLDALNHTSAQISIHRMDGVTLMRNPAAAAASTADTSAARTSAAVGRHPAETVRTPGGRSVWVIRPAARPGWAPG